MEQKSPLLSPVNSKTISAMGYEDNKMYVKFSSGVIYQYDDVSHKEYMSIIEDDSPGSKLRRVVADKMYVKLDK